MQLKSRSHYGRERSEEMNEIHSRKQPLLGTPIINRSSSGSSWRNNGQKSKKNNEGYKELSFGVDNQGQDESEPALESPLIPLVDSPTHGPPSPPYMKATSSTTAEDSRPQHQQSGGVVTTALISLPSPQMPKGGPIQPPPQPTVPPPPPPSCTSSGSSSVTHSVLRISSL